MATVPERISALRRQRMRTAAERWQARAPERQAGLTRLSTQGPGSADPPGHRTAWAQREASKARMGVPRFGERVLGTADFDAFAPSARAAGIAAPVARICTSPDGGHAAQGIATGLLLPGCLLLTNHHVFGTPGEARGYAANFGHARDERGVLEGSYFEIDPDGMFVTDAELDFTIVALQPTGLGGEALAAITPMPLIESPGKVLTGMPVNIVQHPGGGPRQFAVSNNRLLDILPTGFLQYEADTDHGSSGSPVFNPDWELIALHHCGVPAMKEGQFMKRDGTVWREDHDPESELQWVANEGTRVSFIVSRLKAMTLDDPTTRRRRDALLATTADPYLPGTTPAPSPAGAMPADRRDDSRPAGSAASTASVQFNGPVTIHIHGTAAVAAPDADTRPAAALASRPAPAATVADEKALVFDSDYRSRSGYDRMFLGHDLPAPTVDAARQAELYTTRDYRSHFDTFHGVPRLDTDGLQPDAALVLDYHHYSLVMNKTHRMCMWTAANCDYRPQSRQDGRKRSAFGSESWRFDPRVPPQMQLSDADVYQPARRVDRGHIVRREDNCWGAPGPATEFANADTYHWTNCTPQHEAFNRESPSDASGQNLYAAGNVRGQWGAFEDRVADRILASGGLAVQFAGPVLKDFFEAHDWGAGSIRIPKYFWKIVIVPASLKKDAGLLAYGYVFTQVPVVKQFGLTFEGMDLPEFNRQRTPIADITRLTGVHFPPAVLKAEAR